MQVIKSGVLTVTKGWTAAGGIAGLAAAIGAIVTALKGQGVSDMETAVLFGGCAFVLAAVVIGIALLVQADLAARGVATAARHAGRAEVAASFLRATGQWPAPVAVGMAATADKAAADK